MDEGTARRLGARITLLREQVGLSISELAARTGTAKSYLAKLERGESLNLGMVTLTAVAKALGVTVHDLLPRAEPAGGEAPADAERGNVSVHFETIAESLPAPLQAFLAEEAAQNRPVPIEAVRALAVVKLRGKHPESQDDYRLLYGLMRRLLS